MISEQDIYHHASLMLRDRKLGDALMQASQMVDDCWVRRDLEGRYKWIRITLAIQELANQKLN
ncbi:MAG: hypothetical protein ABWY00_16680 [Dongiaceae bacterium]|jgi:hypothetical protein